MDRLLEYQARFNVNYVVIFMGEEAYEKYTDRVELTKKVLARFRFNGCPVIKCDRLPKKSVVFGMIKSVPDEDETGEKAGSAGSEIKQTS